MVDQIKTILENILPKSTFIEVTEHKGFFSERQYIKIVFAASDKLINNVRGQLPQVVSLLLDINTLILETKMFRGCGGNVVYRNPNPNDSNEQYLAMKAIKVPFRKPKPIEKSVITAIEKFATNWLKVLRENKENLMYTDLVDYDEFLN